jgi:hypothetical protein
MNDVIMVFQWANALLRGREIPLESAEQAKQVKEDLLRLYNLAAISRKDGKTLFYPKLQPK